jgi:hypothetical protein
VINTTKMASVSLAHGDLMALIDELDVRIQTLGRDAEDARRDGDAARAAAGQARRDHVQRLREYLEVCAGSLVELEQSRASRGSGPEIIAERSR